MENTSYALQIAAGVLIAIILIGIVLFVFRGISTEKKKEDDVLDATNKSEFNQAFLAYDKPLMYGTDVLSCLNKAQSNNQKYVYNNYYGTDNSKESKEEYIIYVNVTLKKTLEEKVTVYTRNISGMISPNPTFEDTSIKPFSTAGVHFKVPTVKYYYFENKNIKNVLKETSAPYAKVMWHGVSGAVNQNSALENKSYETSIRGGQKYSLIGDGSNNISKISALLTTVTDVEQRIDNSNENDNTWEYAIWRTAAYDFKTRKFRCSNRKYSDETGYINLMEFEEVTE